MTLDAPYYPEDGDDALEWAVDREFELRSASYEFLKNGGLLGAIQRATERIRIFNLALVGFREDEETDDAVTNPVLGI